MGRQKPCMHTVISGTRHYYKQICICVPCLETEVSPFTPLGIFFFPVTEQAHKMGSVTESTLEWRMFFFLHGFGIKVGNAVVARSRH